MSELNKSRPPGWAEAFLKWYCASHLLEEVQGDLEEEFDHQVKQVGKRRAQWDYIRNVIGFINVSAFKRKASNHSSPLINHSMLKHYFVIAFRSLWRNKVYSFINFSGLSVGITVSTLILLFVSHEFSYDMFHKNIERIYRVEKQFSRDGRYSIYSSPEFGPMMKERNASVRNYVRILEPGRTVIKSGQQHRFIEDKFVFADTSFFSIFSFDLIRGERSLLARPNTVIITEDMAKKYFAEVDPLGKVLIYDKDHSFEIVGIAKNPPSNSSIHFDFVASFNSLLTMSSTRNLILNNSSAFPTYLLLQDKSVLPEVEEVIRKSEYTNKSLAYFIKPFSNAHFNLNFGDISNTRYVSIFLCIAVLVLALALINYMNLATARATARAKEVGVRKVIGARPLNLSAQFYLESAITLVLSFGLALVMIQFFTPFFLNVLQEKIDTTFIKSPLVIGLFGTLLLTCVLLAGSYPALVLSRFKPVETLRGKFSGSGQGVWIRKVFMVFQFGVSVCLIIGSLVIQHQLNFIQDKKIGIEKEQVMVIPIDASVSKSCYAMKDEISQQSGVKKVAAASVPIFKDEMKGLSLISTPVTNQKVGVKWIVIDNDFIETLGISWKEKPESDKMENKQLINEMASEVLEIADLPVGKVLSMGDGDNPYGNTRSEIVGVVKDFNFKTLRAPIDPLVLTVKSDTLLIKKGGSIYVRFASSVHYDEQIASIKKIYESHENEIPFSYYFLDDAFDQLYKGESRLAKIFNVFTTVAISIACLGLFGLVTFTTERRTKEFGIRKVLGASVKNILFLLSNELMLLLLISVTLASPLALLAMKSWLSQFSYQVEIPIGYFFASGACVFVVALLTISFQAIRSAIANPVDSLKNE